MRALVVVSQLHKRSDQRGSDMRSGAESWRHESRRDGMRYLVGIRCTAQPAKNPAKAEGTVSRPSTARETRPGGTPSRVRKEVEGSFPSPATELATKQAPLLYSDKVVPNDVSGGLYARYAHGLRVVASHSRCDRAA